MLFNIYRRKLFVHLLMYVHTYQRNTQVEEEERNSLLVKLRCNEACEESLTLIFHRINIFYDFCVKLHKKKTNAC
jgi:hypothetical protein